MLADCEVQLKANSKLKDFSRIPRRKSQPSGRWKWVAAAVMLLPVTVLAVTQFARLTELFRVEHATTDPITADSGPLAKTTTGWRGSPADAPQPNIVPFDAKETKKHQEKSAAYAKVSIEYTNSIGMEFVIVPKGTSWLGGGHDNVGGNEVVIPADFYLGKYEVTQEEWEKLMGENPSHFSRNGEGKDAVKDIADADLKRFPVENVSWDRCLVFVAKLNKLGSEDRLGLSVADGGGMGVRVSGRPDVGVGQTEQRL